MTQDHNSFVRDISVLKKITKIQMDFQPFGKWHSKSLGISSDLLHKKYHLFQNDNRICSECCIDIDGIFYIQHIVISPKSYIKN